MYFIKNFTFISILLFILNSCGGKLPGADAKKYPPEPEKRVKKNLEEENLKREKAGEKNLLKIPVGKEIQKRIKMFKKDHEPLAKFLNTGVSLRLQYKDSCIAEDIIGEFVKRDIPILAIHDSFIVPISKSTELYNSMINSFNTLSYSSLPNIKGYTRV